MKKASMGARIGALLLDNIFLNIINLFIFAIYPYYLFYLFYSPVITFLYYGICEGSSMSASLGKKICGLVVVDERGNKLTSAQGFTRSICRIISGAICGIGYFIALFDEEGKALHDKMARTFVAVAAPEPYPYPSPIPVNAPMNNYPTVVCISGPCAGKAFNIPQQGITFGRDSNLCEIAFSENTKGISRIHCKVLFNYQTQMFVLYDMGSSYGTFLENGTKVLQDQPVALSSGQGFYLASNSNFFRVNI
ncbi:MAG TPA: RDD family protein [Mobilitalea sp.]|nr:RDD family protein [Mobilitalea sp.]